MLNVFFKKFWFPRRLRPTVLKVFGAEIGRECLIRQGVKIHWPWKLKMGNNVWLGEDAWILNLETVSIGDSVCISQNAFLCTGSHDPKSLGFFFKNQPITIGNNVWVCARAFILPGAKIPNNSIIPANTRFPRTSK